jgi:hypothetical protein
VRECCVSFISLKGDDRNYNNDDAHVSITYGE